MHLYDPVTFGESTPHNGDYVACSANPENGILGKIESDTEILETRTPVGRIGIEQGWGDPRYWPSKNIRVTKGKVALRVAVMQ